MLMEKNKFGFLQLLKQYGIIRFLESLSLWVSVLLTIIYYAVFFSFRGSFQDAIITFEELHKLLIGSSASLFGILFAAYAIIVALSDKEFVQLLKKLKMLENLFFPFWYTASLYLLAIIINLFSLIVPLKFFCVFSVSGMFFFLWAITESFYIISTTVKFGLYRAELYSPSE